MKSFFFIADLHSLTTIKDAEVREKENVKCRWRAAWLAFGFDTDKNCILQTGVYGASGN